MKKNYLIIIFIFLSFRVFSQNDSSDKVVTDWSTLAAGIGLDYGGWGFNYAYYPQKNIGLFAAGGVLWGSIGYNLGFKARAFLNKRGSKITPFVKGMYGYNAAFILKDRSKLNKTFYGFSYGCGIDLSLKDLSTRKAYWSFSVLVPVATDKAKEYETYINQRSIDPISIPKFTISVGYNMILGRK